MGSEVSLTLADYDALRNKIADAERRAADLEREMVQVKADAQKEVEPRLAAAYAAAKNVVDFAVANLHPEFIRDMPWEALGDLAELVGVVGGDPRDGERAIVWREHTRMIIKYEQERKLRGVADPRIVDPTNGGYG